MPIAEKDFQEAHEQFQRNLFNSGRRSGPGYVSDDECKPLVWYDQCFERGITPAGTVNCSRALRVGSTLNGLDVMLVASNGNASQLKIAAGGTITFSFLQGDTMDGPFEEVGPSICVKAPAGGMSVEPDGLVVKVSPGNFKKPWLKVKLEFAGAISGGAVDCALAYQPR